MGTRGRWWVVPDPGRVYAASLSDIQKEPRPLLCLWVTVPCCPVSPCARHTPASLTELGQGGLGRNSVRFFRIKAPAINIPGITASGDPSTEGLPTVVYTLMCHMEARIYPTPWEVVMGKVNCTKSCVCKTATPGREARACCPPHGRADPVSAKRSVGSSLWAVTKQGAPRSIPARPGPARAGQRASCCRR